MVTTQTGLHSVLLVKALAGVASSPAMDRWPEYRARVEAARTLHAGSNPRGDDLRRALVALVRAHAGVDAGGPARPLSPARFCAAIASFTDDHDAPVPRELFPRRAALALVLRFAGAPPGSLTAVDQLRAALEARETSEASATWGALLALHAATRQLARGRDDRALPELAGLSLDARLALGAAIAPFDDADARGGDPLGDTYHYWAMVTAGVYVTRYASRLAAPAAYALFRAAPHLMRLVRGGVFRRVLFYGAHAKVDRLGLAHGVTLGRALSSSVTPRAARGAGRAPSPSARAPRGAPSPRPREAHRP